MADMNSQKRISAALLTLALIWHARGCFMLALALRDASREGLSTVVEKRKPLDKTAHEYLQKAISVVPNYANAWFYEKLVYIEEMKYDPGRKDELTKRAMEMQDKYMTMQKQQQQQAASEAAAPS